uniref:F-box domain-containing protein n=1 Tax=Moniliophthora roreri TaxID=221103 RepID=A0A0W0G6B6_MONRR
MHLAQELVDLIVDELSADATALICVSLVSRSWLSASRKHLFQKLRFLPSPLPRRHRNDRQIRSIEYTTAKIIEICSHPLCTIPNAGPTHVELTAGVDSIFRQLAHRDHYCRRRLSAFKMLLSWLRERSGEERDMMQTYAQKLSWNVQHLTISYIDMEELLEHLLFSAFPRVIHLTLEGPELCSRKSLSDTLSSFASLTHIEVPASQMSLQILESCSTLEHLSITIEFPELKAQFTMINQFLESSLTVRNKCLKHCELELRSNPNDFRVIACLSRHIHFHMIPSWTIKADCKAFVRGCRSTIPHVTAIVLRSWEVFRPLHGLIAKLDQVLSGLVRYPDLRDVELPIVKVEGTVCERSGAHHDMDEVDLERQGRLLFPNCNRKGLLKMCYVYD